MKCSGYRRKFGRTALTVFDTLFNLFPATAAGGKTPLKLKHSSFLKALGKQNNALWEACGDSFFVLLITSK
jgi:hypothetical protein